MIKYLYIHLLFLIKKYGFDKIVVDSEISFQPTFAEMKRVEEVYPIGDEESADVKTFLTLNFILCDVADVRTNRALAILSNSLFSNSPAQVLKALIDSGLGKDVEVSLEDDLRQSMFTVILTIVIIPIKKIILMKSLF